jgi:hypothetical protein
MLKTFITSAVLLTLTTLPTQAQFGPACGPSDGNCQPRSGGQNPYGRICTHQRNGRLSMRTGPGRNYNKITEIPNGNIVALSGGQYGTDGIYWWRANYNGRGGWVRSDYVCNDPQ